MIIKKEFRLVSGTPNILNLPVSVIRNYQEEENSPRHVFAVLELKKRQLRHFTNTKIFNLISDRKKREAVQVVDFDKYPLHTTYNEATKGLIINLKPFEVSEVSQLNPNDLYATIVYAYSFSKLVTGKFKISENYAKTITNYLLSFYVQVFGKDYGLVGIYSQNIGKLKFMIACYVLSAYFGYSNNINLYKTASQLAPYSYTEEYELFRKFDFQRIDQFIKALSDLRVMPGISIQKYTSKLFRFFGINILPAMEDVSRFFSVILTSSVPGTRVVPRNLVKYNEREYHTIIDIMRKMF